MCKCGRNCSSNCGCNQACPPTYFDPAQFTGSGLSATDPVHVNPNFIPAGPAGVAGVGIASVFTNAANHLIVTLTDGRPIDVGAVMTGAPGVGIQSIFINSDGDLVTVTTDGVTKVLGNVILGLRGPAGTNGTNGVDGRGIKAVAVSPTGNLLITYDDNVQVNAGNIAGPQGPVGPDGASITNAQVNPIGNLILIKSDGSQINAGYVTGDDGRGISNVAIDAGGNLIITYTDGALGNAGMARGATGIQGPPGIQGLPGATGAQGPIGLTGVSVVSTQIDGAGDLIVTFTDGDVDNAGHVVGSTGPAGPTGAQGLQGPIGPAGADGAVGPQGPQGLQGVAGNDGATGPQGPQGLQGVAGNDGATGPQGLQGLQGVAGADGVDALPLPLAGDGATTGTIPLGGTLTFAGTGSASVGVAGSTVTVSATDDQTAAEVDFVAAPTGLLAGAVTVEDALQVVDNWTKQVINPGATLPIAAVADAGIQPLLNSGDLKLAETLDIIPAVGADGVIHLYKRHGGLKVHQYSVTGVTTTIASNTIAAADLGHTIDRNDGGLFTFVAGSTQITCNVAGRYIASFTGVANTGGIAGGSVAIDGVPASVHPEVRHHIYVNNVLQAYISEVLGPDTYGTTRNLAHGCVTTVLDLAAGDVIEGRIRNVTDVDLICYFSNITLELL